MRRSNVALYEMRKLLCRQRLNLNVVQLLPFEAVYFILQISIRPQSIGYALLDSFRTLQFTQIRNLCCFKPI